MYQNTKPITRLELNSSGKSRHVRADYSDGHHDRLDLLRSRHALYCAIYGKEISLRQSGNGTNYTNCRDEICLDFMNQGVDLAHRHEWQHLFFKSDPQAAGLMGTYYVELLRSLLTSSGDPTSFISLTLARDVQMLVNALDDIRVNELWRDIYPVSADEIAQRWEDLLLHRLGGIGIPSLSAPLTLIAIYLNFDTRIRHGRGGNRIDVNWIFNLCDEQTMEDMRYMVLRVQDRVHSSFEECLSLVRDFLDKLHGRGLLEILRPSHQSDAHIWGDLMIDSNSDANELENAHRKIEKAVERDSNFLESPILIHLDKEQREQYLDVANRGIQETLQHLKASAKSPPDERLVIEHSNGSDYRPSDPKEEMLIRRLRMELRRVQDRQRVSRGPTGTEVDVQSFINFRCGSGDQDVFRTEERSPGFYGLMLIDMSGSMRSCWDLIDKSVYVLSQSLQDPNVTLDVWGFNAFSSRKTTITHFHNLRNGLSINLNKLRGSTPMAKAFMESEKHLRTQAHKYKHVFLISDGEANIALDGTEDVGFKDMEAQLLKLKEVAQVHPLILLRNSAPQALVRERAVCVLELSELEDSLVRMVSKPLLGSMTSHWGREEKKKMRLHFSA